MRVLLDTQPSSCSFWMTRPSPQQPRRQWPGLENAVLVSPASYWELAIKVSLGKYALTVPFETFWRTGIDGNGFQVLPIELPHAAALTSLPFHHRDPFDRLLVAQAIAEGIPIISCDEAIDAYGVRRIW